MVVPILSIAPHHMPKIWMVYNECTPKILIMKLRCAEIASRGISSRPGLYVIGV